MDFRSDRNLLDCTASTSSFSSGSSNVREARKYPPFRPLTVTISMPNCCRHKISS